MNITQTGVIGFAAAMCAFISGCALAYGSYERLCDQRRKGAMKASIGSSSFLEALSISLECQGVSRWVLIVMIRASLADKELPGGMVRCFSANWSALEGLVRQAGLEGRISREGFVYARCGIMVLGGSLCGITGAVFSSVLLLMGIVIGCVVGSLLPSRSLKQEVRSRSFTAEKQLSQMIEIVILGLRSGMSFDRSLALFHGNFKGALSSSLALVQGQWSHGFIERSEGLRAIARLYDSLLFERLAENIIRSLRFGTSLANNLSLLAIEARAVRKAKLEERVAKAPIKMLLPIGTLILPAMLILIMGPIMLDLMQGF